MDAVDARTARLERVDRSQRWLSILVGLAVVALAAWMTVEGMSPHPIRKDTEAGVAAAAASASSAAAPDAAAAAASAADASSDLDAGLFLPAISLGDASITLGSGAPRQVKLGLILVTYQGAEGAPSNARSKADARAIADRLGQEAKSDFHHAVASGDSGSSDDIGRIPRGVLDPRTEASVFALSSGEVSEVLETPKGFWIVKRIDP